MCLIVAQFFPFLLLDFINVGCFIVRYTLSVNNTAGEAGQPKMYFGDRRNFCAKFDPSHFQMCCYGNMLDHGCASFLFLWRAMVVYPCDIHKVSRLLTGKKGQLKKS